MIKRTIQFRHCLILSCLGIFIFIINILKIYNKNKLLYIPGEHWDEFLVNTNGCRLPYMNPFDISIIDFIKKEKLPKCEEEKLPLVVSDDDTITIKHDRKNLFTHKKSGEFKCCYKPFWRLEPEKHSHDCRSVKYGPCIPINNTAKISDEFIRVTCNINREIIYEDYFSFVPNKNNSTPTFKTPPMNVLMIGLDGMSRLNVVRQMPKTYKYLQLINSFEFLGYNKVGDNTFPNLLPALTGLSIDEAVKTCWPNNSYFDSCPFIWNDFKENGFYTSYAEDSAWMSAFLLNKYGFRKQPVDYYWTFFNKIAVTHIGNTALFNVKLCVGHQYQFKMFIDYLSKFVLKMYTYRRNFFSLFWSNSISHDYLNKPQLADDYYYNLIKKFNNEGYLNNTILIFFSDHGIRWGKIRETYQGVIEERLPFLFLTLPHEFHLKHPDLIKILETNTRQLVTPFDLHETLRDLRNPHSIARNRSYSGGIKRGYSLFETIPPERNCENAGISSHWCTCQATTLLSVDSQTIREVTLFAVEQINDKLKHFPQCAILSLDQILNARLHEHKPHLKKGGIMSKDYTVTFRTNFGSALFEATIREYHTTEMSLHYSILGTISRINVYGNQSKCVSDFRLKLYCYCQDNKTSIQ